MTENCMNCKYDILCRCVNEDSIFYHTEVDCDNTCEEWENEDGTNRIESENKE